MADITLTLSAAHLARALDALGSAWTPTLANGDPNPETKAQMARARLIAWVRDETLAYERAVARQAAIDAVPLTEVVDIT